MRFRKSAGVIVVMICACAPLMGDTGKAKSIPAGVLLALARDQKAYCDQYLGTYRKDCKEVFRANLSWRELVITPAGQTAILVVNGESCGSGGCAISLFIQQTDLKFIQILGTDGEIGTLRSVKVLSTVSKKHFDIEKTWHDGKTVTRYTWDGERYTSLPE